MSTEPSREARSVINHGRLLNTRACFRLRRASLASAIAFGLTLGVAGQAGSAPIGVSITKIVDTDTVVPVVVPDKPTVDTGGEFVDGVGTLSN